MPRSSWKSMPGWGAERPRGALPSSPRNSTPFLGLGGRRYNLTMKRVGAAALALTCAFVFAAAGSAAVSVQAPDSSGQSSGQTNLPEAPQPSQDRDSRATPADTAPPPEPANTAPSRSDTSPPEPSPNAGVERKPEQSSSSSEQTRGDIAPPREDELAHPGVGDAHEWNPLRAMKDVEVGTYYYNVGNYKAAISRFREALEFKPRDAVATFKLAQALEKNGELDEARAHYQAYLAILNDGPSASEARKALERLRKK